MSDDDQKKVLRRLRRIELKLDVLIESQGLGGEVARREQEQQEEFARRAQETAQQFRGSMGR